MVNPVTVTIHARCLIRNKKKKNEEHYFLLASKRSWANVFYPLLQKYIKKKNNTEGILGYTVLYKQHSLLKMSGRDIT